MPPTLIKHKAKSFDKGWRVYSVDEDTGEVIHIRFDGVKHREIIKDAKVKDYQ